MSKWEKFFRMGDSDNATEKDKGTATVTTSAHEGKTVENGEKVDLGLGYGFLDFFSDDVSYGKLTDSKITFVVIEDESFNSKVASTIISRSITTGFVCIIRYSNKVAVSKIIHAENLKTELDALLSDVSLGMRIKGKHYVPIESFKPVSDSRLRRTRKSTSKVTTKAGTKPTTKISTSQQAEIIKPQEGEVVTQNKEIIPKPESTTVDKPLVVENVEETKEVEASAVLSKVEQEETIYTCVTLEREKADGNDENPTDLVDRSTFYDAILALKKILNKVLGKQVDVNYKTYKITSAEIIGLGTCKDRNSFTKKEEAERCFFEIVNNPNIVTKYYCLTDQDIVDTAAFGFRSIATVSNKYV